MITNLKSKFICLITALIIASSSCSFAEENEPVKISSQYPPIEDELIKSEKFNGVNPVYLQDKAPIVDDVVEPFQQAGKTLILWAQKKGEKISTPIEDELITNVFKKKNTKNFFLKRAKSPIEDTFARSSLDIKKISILKKKETYDFTKEQVPIELKVIRNLSTKKDLKEGQAITFKTVNDVVINGKVLPRGTKVTGKVELVSASDKMGTPFNIVIDNFNVKNPEVENEEINKPEENNSIRFHGTISKSGANRAVWVYPLYQAGNLVLYVAGFAFVPIHGGHAKLLTSETYTVYYETH